MSEKKVVGRNLAIALGIICVVLAAGLVGAVANYTLIINNKDSAIQSKDSQIQQLQTWLQENNTYYNFQINSLNSQIESLQGQVASANSQISSLNSQITTLQSQVNDLTAIINLSKSKLKTLVYHVQETGEDWCHAPDINHIYQQILTLNQNRCRILLLPQRNYENWTEQLAWLTDNFAGTGIPVMLDIFGAGTKETPVPMLSTDDIMAVMAVCDVEWLRFAEVVAWHIDRNLPFPTEYVTTILNFCREHNLKLFWTEYKVGDNVFQKIQTYITGFEDIVTVSFSTNSGDLEPADGFIIISKMFQHWGGSVQSWYWETRHRPNDDPLALSFQMPISLLIEHSLLAKYIGAEVIQFEPYWYFFDNGEAKDSLRLLETMLA